MADTLTTHDLKTLTPPPLEEASTLAPFFELSENDRQLAAARTTATQSPSVDPQPDAALQEANLDLKRAKLKRQTFLGERYKTLEKWNSLNAMITRDRQILGTEHHKLICAILSEFLSQEAKQVLVT